MCALRVLDVEFGILMGKLLASAVPEILHLPHTDVLPAVAPQLQGLTLLQYPASRLEHQPVCKHRAQPGPAVSARGHAPQALLLIAESRMGPA